MYDLLNSNINIRGYLSEVCLYSFWIFLELKDATPLRILGYVTQFQG